jgi:hypothetical protein
MLLNQLSVVCAIMLALMQVVSAHMVMSSPAPFGSPNNSPLDPSGSDFPCKMVPGGSTEGKMNEFAVGSSQTLSFTGSAVHGGGSCQLSVTLDNPPTKDSKFKVIYSIEGGCPASAGGNLADGINDAGTFPFTVPTELPNGKAILAWTWFNKIGNREMYMNCANIDVIGGASDNTAFESLPDMAVANIAETTCHTAESSDFTFETPGQYTTRIGTGPFVGLCGGAEAPAGPPAQPAPGMSSTVAPAPGQMTNVPDPQITSTNAPAPQITSTIRTIITVTAPSNPASTAAQTPVSTPSTAPVLSGVPVPPAGNTDGSCGTEGAVVCNSKSQWGLCDHGKVVFQPVAAGTTCQDGLIAKRDFTHRVQRTAIYMH